MSEPTTPGAGGLREDVTPDAVTALRSAADNLPVSRPGQSQHQSAEWLRARADAFEAALSAAVPSTDPAPAAPAAVGGGLSAAERSWGITRENGQTVYAESDVERILAARERARDAAVEQVARVEALFQDAYGGNSHRGLTGNHVSLYDLRAALRGEQQG